MIRHLLLICMCIIMYNSLCPVVWLNLTYELVSDLNVPTYISSLWTKALSSVTVVFIKESFYLALIFQEYL